MTDDLVTKADGFKLSVDPTPDDVNEANFLINSLSQRLAQVINERNIARSAVHRISHDGEKFSAFMHPEDSEANAAHMAAYRQWRKAVNEAWTAVFLTEGTGHE